jgi:hypothetical protein
MNYRQHDLKLLPPIMQKTQRAHDKEKLGRCEGNGLQCLLNDVNIIEKQRAKGERGRKKRIEEGRSEGGNGKQGRQRERERARRERGGEGGREGAVGRPEARWRGREREREDKRRGKAEWEEE